MDRLRYKLAATKIRTLAIALAVVGLLLVGYAAIVRVKENWSRKHRQAEPLATAVAAPSSPTANQDGASNSLLAWRATPEIIARFKDLANENASVDIIFFDASHFPFAERLASGFEAAGWSVDFTKEAQGRYNPHYRGGIEVKGDNRYFVESIASTLQSLARSPLKTRIGATTIPRSNPKYETARNRIWITIGYEE